MQPKLLLDYELAVQQSGYVVRALLELEGRAPESAARVPLNLALVLDRSGSMSGEKLVRAREAAAFLVRRLRLEDTISVVAYDDEVVTIAERAKGADHPDLPRRIEDIEPGGTTNLSGGWLRGRELVGEEKRHAAEREAMHRVLLLTDGLANVGITDPARLVGLCRAAKQAGISTSTIGFGEDYDEVLLREMADAGGGSAYYIERPDQAPGVLEEEIEGLLSLAAQNVRVEIEPSDAVQLVAVHHQYPLTETAKGARVELGDLYAREPKALLVEFFVPGIDAGREVAVGTIAVTAHVMTEGGGVEREEIALPLSVPLFGEARAEPEVRREMLLLDAARAREAALRRRDDGDFRAAGTVLREVAARLREAPPAFGADLAEQAADLTEMAGKMEAMDFDAADAKYVAQRAYNVYRKRELYEQKLSRGAGRGRQGE